LECVAAQRRLESWRSAVACHTRVYALPTAKAWGSLLLRARRQR
jgi:hypothetical protein